MHSVMVFTVMLLLVNPVQSQKLSAGLTGGVAFQNMELKSINEGSADIDNVIGPELGAHLLVELGGLYVRPTALVGFSQGKAISTVSESEKLESTFSISTFETPVIVGLHLLPFLSVEAGPLWSYILNYSDNVNGIEVDLNRNYFGYRAGVQLSFSRLGIYGHYGGIVNNSSGSDFQIERPSRIIVGLNVNLGSQK